MKASLGARLLLANAAVVLGLLVVGLRSRETLREAEEVVRRLAERSRQGIRLSGELETLMHEKSYVSNYLLSHDRTYLETGGAHHQEFKTWIEAMDEFASDERERALTQRMRVTYFEYLSHGDEVVRLEESGDSVAARASFFAMKDRAEHVLTDAQTLFALAAEDMQLQRDTANRAIERELRLMTWILLPGILASFIGAFLLARVAARPIYRLALRIGETGLIDQFEFKGDEIGVLASHVEALLSRVRQQERALQRAEKLSEFGEIAAQIAHQTLNPLAGAKGMLQALRRTPLPPERLAVELADVERDLDRIEGIVRRLVKYARPLEPSVAPVRIPELLERAVQVAQKSPGASGRRIEIQAEDAELRWVLDGALIEEVLINLLVNACEASPPGASVRLLAKVAEDQLAVRVEDHGRGLSEADRQKLFHPFFTTKPSGNGLGLAISRNIVQRHGGIIEGRPGLEGGSVFELLLPRGEAPCAEAS